MMMMMIMVTMMVMKVMTMTLTMMTTGGSDMQSAAVSADKAEGTLTIVTQPHSSYST